MRITRVLAQEVLVNAARYLAHCGPGVIRIGELPNLFPATIQLKEQIAHEVFFNR
jgi:hypothetical protein